MAEETNDKLRDLKLTVNFQSLLQQFNEIQENLDLLNDTDNFDLSNKERDDFEKRYYDLDEQVENLINQYNDKLTLNSVKTSEINPVQSHVNSLRLPEINLPKFAGNYEEWYDYYNTFDSLINSKDTLSNVQKLQYLKSVLRGEAAEILSSLEITEANYDCAWKMLVERYDNKRLIVNKHIRAIHDLPSMARENFKILRQIIDGVTKHMRILLSLDRPTDSWDDLIIYVISNKLDSCTIRDWETTLSKNNLPILKSLIDFLTKRCETLEAISRTQPHSNNKTAHSISHKQGQSVVAHVSIDKLICFFCNIKGHTIYNCIKLKNLSIEERVKQIKHKNLCANCLRKGHLSSACSSGTCKKCPEKHNTLLHVDSDSSGSTSAQQEQVSISACTRHSLFKATQVLLSTAIVLVRDSAGRYQHCRALLDSGSQSCFMTSDCAKRLNLTSINVDIPVLGINNTQSSVCSKTSVAIKSCYNAFRANINCLILKEITSYLPIYSVDSNQVQIPKNIKLADPDFNKSNSIDLLIAAELFWSLLCVGQIKSGRNQPIFQKTQLGWIVSGKIPSTSGSSKTTSCNIALDTQLNEKLMKFWMLEEYANTPPYSPEEKLCEEHFSSTYTRDNSGRFTVKIPFKENGPSSLGESKLQAEKRLHSLERKFRKNQSLKENYAAFINEYLALDHMKPILPEDDNKSLPSYYLPHHAVIKESSLTTKLRVVFDGSAKTTTGISLNDIQIVGPTIQQDLLSIIMRFRSHKYVITADIAKMYRQVLVHPSQRRLQRILWRENENDEIKTYELATVTYGTASAAFLAVRSLQQLARDEHHNHPLASKIVLRDFYIDDLLTGGSSKDEISRIQQELCEILPKGGFILHKWVSNCPELVNNISSEFANTTISLNKEDNTSVLGLQWNANRDYFTFSLNVNPTSKPTKRGILSEIAKIFDPLGLIGPIIINAKLIMQQLWQIQLEWDESIPLSIHTQWMSFKNQLNTLETLYIPRCVVAPEQAHRIELHGFSDASERAYGACIYLRITCQEGRHHSNLLCAKSRVAPLKNISLPKLELCGAVLLARLMKKVTNVLCLNINNIFYWTDSTIVLSLIKSTSRNFKTFVSNRIGEIQELSNPACWHHVRTNENPADIISRGCNSSVLLNSNLWWHGEPWLSQDFEKITASHLLIPENELPERRTAVINFNIQVNEFNIFTFSKYSRLIRVMAYCLRFLQNSRTKNTNEKLTSPLSVQEINSATTKLIKMVQNSSFSEDMKQLIKNKCVSRNSKLLALNPFIDENNIMRVGGRLFNATIPFSQKHPIVLPKAHIFTKLLIEYEHIRNLHAGSQTVLTAIRQKYWPLGGRYLVRNIIHKCMTCFKLKPTAFQPLMGHLPSQRVTPSRPFTQCGVNFFGLITIRESRKRNYKTMKSYGAIFIYLATKAVHIELATDLTTEAFLATMKRFISRRGKPKDMFSDNGTNFVGANHELHRLYELFNNDHCRNNIIASMSTDGINWHFIQVLLTLVASEKPQ